MAQEIPTPICWRDKMNQALLPTSYPFLTAFDRITIMEYLVIMQDAMKEAVTIGLGNIPVKSILIDFERDSFFLFEK